MAQRPLPDYYSILQVAPTAETAVIEAAYRQLARLYHPDVNNAPDAGVRMQAINAAYGVLRDPHRRARYDRLRERRGWHSARALGLHRQDDWLVFRLGEAADAFRTIAALEAAVPPNARRWDPETQSWQVHAAHAGILSQLFLEVPPQADAPLPLLDPVVARPWLPPWQELAAVAVCLTALAILVYIAETSGLGWRERLTDALGSLLASLDPGIAANLGLWLLAVLAALVMGYIAWTFWRPSRPSR